MVAAQILRLQCECGEVAGRLEVVDGRRDYVVCHCTDCQDFARLFDAEARILDEADGTHLLQTRCATLKLEQGGDELACIHLTDKPTLRWYASCCDTPMFNTYTNAKVPYITTLLANCDSEHKNRVAGELLGHLFPGDAGAKGEGFEQAPMLKLLRGVGSRMVRDILSGDRKRTALFDAETLQPIATPRRLTDDERARLARH